MRGRERRAFSMLKVLPSYNSPCNPSLAASACCPFIMLTKPNPRDSLVCGSRIILHFSTSPYFSKSRATSVSERRGWMPVTKRFEPLLRACSSSSSVGALIVGPLLLVSDTLDVKGVQATHRESMRSSRSRPLGDALRALLSPLPRPSGRGERLRARS